MRDSHDLLLFLGKAQRTILAGFDRARTLERNIFDRMSHSATAAVANGHFAIDFDGRNLHDQFQSVGSVLAEFVLL